MRGEFYGREPKSSSIGMVPSQKFSPYISGGNLTKEGTSDGHCTGWMKESRGHG